MLRHLFHAVEGLVNLLLAFETEGDGDDTYSEDAQFFRHAGDDGSSTGAGATTHAGGDERHLRAVVEHALQRAFTLFGSGTRSLGLVACSQTFSTQLQVYRNGGVVERLTVGVAEHEGDIVDAFLVHVVHGVAATATHTDDFNDAVLFWQVFEFEAL